MTASSPAVGCPGELLLPMAKVAPQLEPKQLKKSKEMPPEIAYHLQCLAYSQPRLDGRSLLIGSGHIQASLATKLPNTAKQLCVK